MKRQRPAASDEEIEEAVCEWRTKRPGADLGHAPAVAAVTVVVNLLESALRRVAADLDSQKGDWAIVGGLAVLSCVSRKRTDPPLR